MSQGGRHDHHLPLSWDLHLNLKFLVLTSTCHALQGLRESSLACLAPPPGCVSFQVCAEVTIQNTGGARACKPLLVPRATDLAPQAPGNGITKNRNSKVGYSFTTWSPSRNGLTSTRVPVVKSRMWGPSSRVTPCHHRTFAARQKTPCWPSPLRYDVSSRRIFA